MVLLTLSATDWPVHSQGAPRPALDAKLRAARQLGKESQRVISDRVRPMNARFRGCVVKLMLILIYVWGPGEPLR